MILFHHFRKTSYLVLTASIIVFITISYTAAQATKASLLKQALDALQHDKPYEAITIEQKLPPNSIESKIICWAIATANCKSINSLTIEKYYKKLPHWSNLSVIQKNYERASYREILAKSVLPNQHNEPKLLISQEEAEDFIDYFSHAEPKTFGGRLIYLVSAIKTRDIALARNLLKNIWYNHNLDESQQAQLIANSANLLSPIDYAHRLRFLLLKQNYSCARAIANLGYSSKLYSSFSYIMKNGLKPALLAYKKNRINLEKQLKILGSADKFGAIYYYAKIKILLSREQYSEAANIISHLPRSKSFLINPNLWCNLKISIAKDLVLKKQYRIAYNLLKAPDNSKADLAQKLHFYAGWIALRKLNQPRLAIAEFRKMIIGKENQDNDDLQAQANYWLARSYEALHAKQTAYKYYHKAASNSTNFYGQLACRKIHQKLDISYPIPSRKVKQQFYKREQVKVLQMLYKTGDQYFSRLFATSLASNLSNRYELALLTALCHAYGDHFTEVTIAKVATKRGFDMGCLTHPLGIIKGPAKTTRKQKALLYAIARQETEFRPNVVSKVGAVGIMQVMPETACEISRKLLHHHCAKRLLIDPVYNVRIAYIFLCRQLEEFDGSYLLTIAAYNAGPNRVKEWIEKFGDPRKMSLEASIDWIQQIPYSETRNYVVKVLANLQFYDCLLKE